MSDPERVEAFLEMLGIISRMTGVWIEGQPHTEDGEMRVRAIDDDRVIEEGLFCSKEITYSK